MFGANLVILAQICDELSRGQAEFRRILSQNDLEDQGQYDNLHFLYQPRVYQDACLVKIWWLKPKSVARYRADKPNFP